MICKYDDGNGWCTGKFKGFGCIKNNCDSYTPAENVEDDCKGLEGKGIYCPKYKRFYCAGKENCSDITDYIRKMEMSSGL